MLFRTNRLIVREFVPSDLDAFYKMQSNPNVMRYIKPPLSYEESEAELNLFIKYYTDSDKFYNLWAVVDSDSNDFVGMCGVYQNMQSNYELAYRLKESAWGQGFGSEVAKNLIKYCIHDLELNNLVAYAASNNIGSVKILERNMNFIEEKLHQRTGAMGRKYELVISS